MECSQLYRALEELLELTPGTVTGAELVADLPGWDSMAIVGFIAMVDEMFGVIVPASRLLQCKTTAELAELVRSCSSNTPAE
jgi:acyl carrier protein